ncbi:putative phospholipase [Teratosphaeria destructans]|uniref:Phospholipase n=1 Tax=Teratosphaeria destructans TaxID=418781 RepID=A0A9W7SPG1_9PEZI|nr:putative phospholipase [Teratosphaeria destructans]
MAADSAGQSYLSKLSPWSRTPPGPSTEAKDGEPKTPPLQRQKGGDHVVTHRHRLSLKKYPRDCPPVRPCWFHAVDVPKRRPQPTGGEFKEEKPAATPKKYAAFSVTDSKAIEAAFQKLLEEEDSSGGNQAEQRLGDLSLRDSDQYPRSDDQPNTSLKDDKQPCKVPVNEDYLFDVEVEKRELAPAYWLGPVYDVRRGTWFYQDGSTQRPCDENLAAQLEEGYLKLRPWRFPQPQPSSSKQRSTSSPPKESKPRPTSWAPDMAADRAKPSASTQLTPQTSSGDLRAQASNQAQQTTVETGQDERPQNTYRLFGSHMNSVVTYQDGKTAWLLTDDFMSRMNYSVYQRFAGGGHFAGIKLTRGWVNPLKPSVEKDGKAADAKESKATGGSKESGEHLDQAAEEQQANRPSLSETRRQNLQRQMSSLLEDPSKEDPDKQDEEVRRRDEREIEEDYREAEGEEQGREIEHLILVTHGIGQRLGLRLESVNFVHDVNTLRKTMKAVYADSPDLRALNAELAESESVNSRVQVLPICWRHLLDFPKQSLKHNRKEHDLGDTEIEDDDFPSLDDITVEGVPAVRNLITDLALDILLYQSPAYKDHISRIVVSECNRIYHLFMERNPEFSGKISFVGHSLGSAIMFDILCTQGQQLHSPQRGHHRETQALKLDFEVEDFYALGSPIGLFQMLKGRNIVARAKPDARKRAASASIDDDPMLGAPSLASRKTLPSLDPTSATEIAQSSPKCSQIFNIFHPTDPISYRIEPLISPAMASLKPQPLPYTKRGIFGAPMGQGLTGIGARVSQSVSSMWSSMASSLLTRGLGYTGTEATHMPAMARPRNPPVRCPSAKAPAPTSRPA